MDERDQALAEILKHTEDDITWEHVIEILDRYDVPQVNRKALLLGIWAQLTFGTPLERAVDHVMNLVTEE